MDIINSDPSWHSAPPRPLLHGSYSRGEELAWVRNGKIKIKKRDMG